MNHEALIQYCLGKPASELKYPFYPDIPVIFVVSKMFALFGFTGDIPSITLKAAPDEAFLQRKQYPDAVLPGYHFNKRHWNTVVLNGQVPEPKLYQMIDDSYLLVVNKLTRLEREQIR